MSLANLPDQVVRRWRRTKYRLTWRWRCARQRRAAGARGELRDLLVAPEYPDIRSALAKVSAYAGLRLMRSADTGVPAIFYLDATVREPPAVLMSRDGRVLNLALRDIGKKHMQAVFESVFGRALAIDPTAYVGDVVAKSDRNAAHDGKVIRCPIPASDVAEGVVYQVLIDNTLARDGRRFVRDFRLSVIGGRFPVCYEKLRPVETRFSNKNTTAALLEPEAVFSDAELAAIREFADRIGADYAELDVLRDNATGLIYVVDVNPTPSGPPNGLPDPDAVRAVERMASALRACVLETAAV